MKKDEQYNPGPKLEEIESAPIHRQKSEAEKKRRPINNRKIRVRKRIKERYLFHLWLQKVREINKCQYCGSSNVWMKEQWEEDKKADDGTEYTVTYQCEECKGLYSIVLELVERKRRNEER